MKIKLFLLLLLPCILIAQHDAESTREFTTQNASRTQGKPIAKLFKESSLRPAVGYRSAVEQGALIDFDAAVAAQIINTATPVLNLELPINASGESLIIVLSEKNIFAEGFKVVTSGEGDVTDQVDLGKHYRGHVIGDQNSMVSISVFREQVIGLIVTNEEAYTVGKMEDSDTTHIVYKDSDMMFTPEFNCEMEDDGAAYTMDEITYNQDSRTPGDCVEIYIEAANGLYSGGFGSNLSNTINFLNGVFAQSYMLYANDGLSLVTSEIFVWTTADPYTASNTAQYVSQFQAQTGAFNGDLGHLVELDNVGGRAAGFSGICNSNTDASLCFSGFSGTGFNNVPTYSFNVYLITHEMGHLLGSRHTHACVWNGNSTAIDGCSGFTEGSCALPGNPPGGGTIMSYCNGTSVGVNFNNGFGPQPAAVINNTINNATCLDTICGPITCTLDVDCSNIVDTPLSCIEDLPTADLTLPIINDSCGAATVSQTTVTSSNTGCPGDPIVITRTYFIQDEDSNMMQCVQTFTVESTNAPTVSAANNTISETLDDSCEYIVPDFTAVATTSVECGIATVSQSPLEGTVITGESATMVTLTVTDFCNRTNTDIITITIEDNTLPEVICLDYTTSLDVNGNATITTADIDGGSSDACGVTSVTLDNDSFSCNDLGANTVTMAVTDTNGNVASCTATVTIEDDIAPTAVCQNITVQLDDTGTVSILAADVNNGSTDNCSVMMTELDTDTFDCSNIGDNTVTLTVTDTSGNTDVCTAIVTVEDTMAPEITCTPAVISLEPNGMATVDASVFVDSGNSSDNCGTITYTIDVTEVDCDDVGMTINVTILADDGNGNTASCMTTMTVEDVTGPVFDQSTLPQGPIVRSIDSATGTYSMEDFTAGIIVSDDCTLGLAAVSVDQNPLVGTSLGVATYDVTITATDDAGNSTDYVFELRVDPLLGTEDLALSQLVLYPNPMQPNVILSSPSSLNLKDVSIFDLQGRLVQKVNLDGMTSEKIIDVSRLKASSYVFVITSETGVLTKTMIKE